MRGARPNARAISLIGVVIVASIVVVTTGAGLWGLRNARENARTIRCAEIMKQYGRAFATYTADYAGVLPYENVGGEAGGHVVWFHALESYVGDSERSCPSVDRDVENAEEAYRINSKLASSADDKPPYRKLATLVQPNVTVVLFDGEYGGQKLSMKGRLKDVQYRHNGSANVLFADWSVSRFDRRELRQASKWLPPKVIWDPEGGEP